MRLEDATEHANALVAAWVLTKFREDGDNQHLRDCPEATLVVDDGYDSVYGCDTGCEYVRFESTVTCPHDEREEFEWGDFDDLASILEQIGATDVPR